MEKILAQVMTGINNHFVRRSETLTFELVSPDTISGPFQETYRAGQYICITDTDTNDGVYKVLSQNGSTIILDTDQLQDEKSSEVFKIFSLKPPADFLALVEYIKTYQSKNSKDGVTSESIDDYSIAFAEDGGWKSVFKKRLDSYRKMYPDLR